MAGMHLLLSVIPSRLLHLTFLLIHLIDDSRERVQRVWRNVHHGTGTRASWQWSVLSGIRCPTSLCSVPVDRSLSCAGRTICIAGSTDLRSVDDRSGVAAFSRAGPTRRIVCNHA